MIDQILKNEKKWRPVEKKSCPEKINLRGDSENASEAKSQADADTLAPPTAMGDTGGVPGGPGGSGAARSVQWGGRSGGEAADGAPPIPCSACGGAIRWSDIYRGEYHCGLCCPPPADSMVKDIELLLQVPDGRGGRVPEWRRLGQGAGSGQNSESGQGECGNPQTTSATPGDCWPDLPAPGEFEPWPGWWVVWAEKNSRKTEKSPMHGGGDAVDRELAPELTVPRGAENVKRPAGVPAKIWCEYLRGKFGPELPGEYRQARGVGRRGKAKAAKGELEPKEKAILFS